MVCLKENLLCLVRPYASLFCVFSVGESYPFHAAVIPHNTSYKLCIRYQQIRPNEQLKVGSPQVCLL